MQELTTRRTPEEVEAGRALEQVESKRSALEEMESTMAREQVERYAARIVCLLPDFCLQNH
jgi:hypothetical protein